MQPVIEIVPYQPEWVAEFRDLAGRLRDGLGDLALRIADRVRRNGQPMTLEPMPPAERRIVHIALADDPDVQTISIGEGEARKVAITPRR